MINAIQYYRPPFPDSLHWNEDVVKIKQLNFNAIQIWVVWAWVESQQGVFDFSDYDELIGLAHKNGLKVILSTIAEIQPYWIHRVFPDSFMKDSSGNIILSSNRHEMHQGLTPGGCFDNPDIISSIEKFLINTAQRYSSHPAIIAWDCWNELRWQVQADGLVCSCEYTLKKFRQWLTNKYVDLNGINNAWKRRYSNIEDIFPPKCSGRTYTEAMEFQRFIAFKCAEHLRFRYNTIKSIDKNHTITAHGHLPSIWQQGDDKVYMEYALMRGNDWSMADEVDTLGCSYFPENEAEIDFCIKLECNRSAVQGKPLWISELLAGSGGSIFGGMPPYSANQQQRYFWNGIARGAKAIIYWTWRDEVFGPEAGCYGLNGSDDLAPERLEAVKESGRILSEREKLFDEYKPDKAEIAVIFEPDNHYLEWARFGFSDYSKNSIAGYLSLIERCGFGFDVLETNHLSNLNSYKIIVLPIPLIINSELNRKLTEYVENGGIIWVEGELDTFSGMGFYNYSGDERSFAEKLNIIASRLKNYENKVIPVTYNYREYKLLSSVGMQTFKGFKGECLSKDESGNPIFIKIKHKKGFVFCAGSFFGMSYLKNPYTDLEQFFKSVLDEADCKKYFDVSESCDIQFKSGISQGIRLLFVINNGIEKNITIKSEFFENCKEILEISSNKILGKTSEDTIRFDIKEGSYKILQIN